MVVGVMTLFGVPWILSPVFMLQNHISEGVCIFERGSVPAASTGFYVGLNMGRLMFWILLKKVGKKEAKVWLWRNVFCAKVSIYCPCLKNTRKKPQQNTPTLLKWGLWLLVYLKKIKNLMLPKQCRLSWLGKCCFSDTLIITIMFWFHYKSWYFGFLLVLVFIFSHNEAAFLNPGFLFSLKDEYPAELP